MTSRMWSQLLTLIFLLVATSGRQVSPEDCRPPHLAIGGQCLLVDTDILEGCTSPFVAVGDQCLYFATFADLSNTEARQMCHSLDSELAKVDTATRLKDIIDYINNNGVGGGSLWIDGSDQVTEGDWRYYSGQPVPMGTPFWEAKIGQQQPDNANDAQDCLLLNDEYLLYMDDASCSNPHRVLCEHPRQVNFTALHPRTECPPFFVDVGGLCLSFMTWADQTWAEARQSCHGLGGELAAVTEIEDLRAIYLYLHQEGIAGHSFWLGGSDTATEGVWTWTDGVTVPSGAPFWGYSSSYNTEPNGGSDENCLLLDAEGFHYFRDASCSHLRNPLCQVLV